MALHRWCSVIGALAIACGPRVHFEGSEAGDCSDGADNDGDGVLDCADPSCASAPECASVLQDAGARDAGVRDGAIADPAPADDGGWVFPSPYDDECGVPDPSFVLSRSQSNITIDTTDLADDVRDACGVEPTPGSDAFIALDVQAGDYWHFHLRVDPEVSGERDPALYLLEAPSGVCDPRGCTHGTDTCSGPNDEHFGFVADAPARIYLGVDDRNPGGFRYLLDAVRPQCGDDTREHGEACDDGNRLDLDGCSRRCMRELSEALPSENEPNDSPFEANMLVMPESGELTVEGVIGGFGSCRYGDVLAVEVPAGARIEVDAMTDADAVCSDGALTDGYELALSNVAYQQVVAPSTDAFGCANLRSAPLSAGLYFITVQLPAELEAPRVYRLRVRVL